jgi:DmsE family decaheme c-type cytochrome
MMTIISFLVLLLLGPQGPPAQQAPDSRFAGSQECATCHEDLSTGFKENPHVRGAACETCHGPGREHVESADITKIRSFKHLTPQKTSAVCLECHQKDATHSNRLFDIHTKKAVTCTSCHSVHSAAQKRPLLTKVTNELCAGCHAAERARFERPFAHQVRNGAMTCVSCHAPHGGASPTKMQMLTNHSNGAACLACHGDKRGPFTFEHMPMKVQGCSGCHEPHGSSNPRMLIRSEVRQLCLECHTNSKSAFGKTPPAFHDLRSERFRNCTVCHTKIHGSHTNPAFLR